MPVLALLFIPMLIGLPPSGPGRIRTTADDHLLEDKQPFLNVAFFVVRAVVYFVVWMLPRAVVPRRSLAQDETPDPGACPSRMRRPRPAPALLLYAVTLTFASIDWLMSVDYAWFSTIFGVYVLSHGVLGAMAVLALLAIGLRRGPLRGTIPEERRTPRPRQAGSSPSPSSGPTSPSASTS